jgi:type II secretory ATPase GspE/PulE/Tfp pilus assembly ATPase PilB-like protein
VIAQRLLRTVCPNCREPVEPDQKMRYFLEDLKLSPDQFPGGKIMLGKGCDECFRSGYAGRTAIYEIMPIDTAIQEQIVNKATASQIKRGALERGLKTLRMDGVAKLLQGLTTPDEVLRVTQLDVV